MNTITGPIDLIKRSFQVFFEKRNLIYFLKIYSPSFVTSLLAFPLGFWLASKGYPLEKYYQWITTANLSIVIPVLIWFIFTFFVGLWTQVSGYEAVKRVIDGGVLEFKDTFRISWKYLGKFFLTGFVVSLITFVGIILVIIPGIIFSVWFAFSLWMIVKKGTGIKDSLKLSKSLVAGKFWGVWGRLIVLGLFGIIVQSALSFTGAGGLILAIFGGLFLLPYYLLYCDLTEAAGSSI